MDEPTAQILLELLELGNQELSPEQAAAVEVHLRGLPEWEVSAQRDREFDDRFGPALRDVAVPADLPKRIHARLAADRGNQWRRRIYQTSGVAAGLLLVIGLGWGLRWSLMPRLDAEQFATQFDAIAQDPFSQAEAWLADQGIVFQPAVALNPSLLTDFQMVEFQGQMVPMLYYTYFPGRATARVYIVDADQFRFSAMSDEARRSFCAVQIFDDVEKPNRRRYVVVYTGVSLTPFLRRGENVTG